MNTRTKCALCDADYALHRADTDHCPVGGVEETRLNHKQEWADTKFTALDDFAPHLREVIREKDNLIKELITMLTKAKDSVIAYETLKFGNYRTEFQGQIDTLIQKATKGN